MMDLDSSQACLLIAIGLISLSLGALWMRARTGRLLTTAGGLHVNVLLFFGLGLLTYVSGAGNSGNIGFGGDRVPYSFVVRGIERAGWPMLLGYGVIILFELRRYLFRRGRSHPPQDLPTDRVEPLFIFSVLAMLGYAGSTSDISSSGLGTIFPVLRQFYFPALVMAVMIASSSRPWTVIVAGAMIVGFGALALLTAWRSELILVTGSIALGMMARRRRISWIAPTGLICALLIFLPFVQEKKVRHEAVTADPASAFVDTLTLSFGERMDFATKFWATRVNGARELGYVVDGLDAFRVRQRNGFTYWEAVQQLVPRFLWSDKPEFNRFTNYRLARDLLLVGDEDEYTSWGVSFYAEAVLNFGIWTLLFFVPLSFLAAFGLDKLIARLITKPAIRWFVSTALFFRVMDMPGFVGVVTFIFWILIVGRTVELLINVARRHRAVLDPSAQPLSNEGSHLR